MPTRLLALLALTLAAAAQNAPKTAGGINSYSLPDDVAMGDRMANDILSRARTLDSPVVQEYIRRLGRQLALQVPDPPFSYEFIVVESLPVGAGVDATLEALPLPGGHIIVPAGLILAAGNTPELAGILAHAIAHVADRDCTRSMTRSELMNVGAAADLHVGCWVVPVRASYMQFQRGFERQADNVAVQMMDAAGFDPGALAAYLQRAQQPGKGSLTRVVSPLPRVFSPLPDKTTRLADIQAQIAKLTSGRKYSEGEELGPIQSEVRAALAETD